MKLRSLKECGTLDEKYVYFREMDIQKYKCGHWIPDGGTIIEYNRWWDSSVFILYHWALM